MNEPKPAKLRRYTNAGLFDKDPRKFADAKLVTYAYAGDNGIFYGDIRGFRKHLDKRVVADTEIEPKKFPLFLKFKGF